MKRTLLTILGILIGSGFILGCGGSHGPAEVNETPVSGVQPNTLDNIPGPGSPKKK